MVPLSFLRTLFIAFLETERMIRNVRCLRGVKEEEESKFAKVVIEKINRTNNVEIKWMTLPNKVPLILSAYYASYSNYKEKGRIITIIITFLIVFLDLYKNTFFGD